MSDDDEQEYPFPEVDADEVQREIELSEKTE